MAPVKITDDYYAVLEVSYDATQEIIRKSYRRLAVDLHPDKNPSNPEATAAFQLLSNAYETINDPEKRRTYNAIWPSISKNRQTEQEAQKREAEAAEKEGRRVAEEKKRRGKEESARQARLQRLYLLKSRHEGDIFESSRVIRKHAADLKRLQDQDDDELRKERNRNSWWTYITSPISSKEEETGEQIQRRETERLQRLAIKTIKENQLAQREAVLHTSRNALDDVNSKIAAVQKEEEDEAREEAVRRKEQWRKKEETRRRAEEEEERRKEQWRKKEEARRRTEEEEESRKQWEEWEAKMIQIRKEQAARVAKAAREVQEAFEAQERARKEATNKHSAESERRAQAGQKPRKARDERACPHDGFWPKLGGRHLCENCHKTQAHFAFQCPGCAMIACADCRQTLRGERRRRRRRRRNE